MNVTIAASHPQYNEIMRHVMTTQSRKRVARPVMPHPFQADIDAVKAALRAQGYRDNLNVIHKA